MNVASNLRSELSHETVLHCYRQGTDYRAPGWKRLRAGANWGNPAIEDTHSNRFNIKD